MSIMSDKWITYMCKTNNMVHPFVEHQVSTNDNGKCISYGLSSYGYDIRCANEFVVYNENSLTIDPKEGLSSLSRMVTANSYTIPPNSFVLVRSMEYIKVPRDVLVVCTGKSTYARCGLVVNTTPLEPEWEGFITIELSNTTKNPLKVYANEGIAQLMFFKGSDPCNVSYRDKKGKYQGQKGVVLPRI